MDANALTMKTFRRLGFRPLGTNKPNANGPDLFVVRGTKAYSVEIKPARKTRRGTLQVRPVKPARRQDDMIAIVLPSGYVLVEPMADHLRLCSAKGYRSLTPLV